LGEKKNTNDTTPITRRVAVLYWASAVWEVGEGHRERADRREMKMHLPASSRYHDDYPGRVISVADSPGAFSAADRADPGRAVIEVEATEAEYQGLMSRTMMIDSRGAVAVVDDDTAGGKPLAAARAAAKAAEKNDVAIEAIMRSIELPASGGE
jgi:hypothetical protein